MKSRLQTIGKTYRIFLFGSTGLRKSHTWKLKGAQLRRNCAPFANSFGPFQARFRILIHVDKIQIADCQHFGNVAKIAYLRSSGLSVVNIVIWEAENEKMFWQLFCPVFSSAKHWQSSNVLSMLLCYWKRQSVEKIIKRLHNGQLFKNRGGAWAYRFRFSCRFCRSG